MRPFLLRIMEWKSAIAKTPKNIIATPHRHIKNRNCVVGARLPMPTTLNTSRPRVAATTDLRKRTQPLISPRRRRYSGVSYRSPALCLW